VSSGTLKLAQPTEVILSVWQCLSEPEAAPQNVSAEAVTATVSNHVINAVVCLWS